MLHILDLVLSMLLIKSRSHEEPQKMTRAVPPMELGEDDK
jgi:hypothetical protein